MSLKIGSTAPDFELESASGATFQFYKEIIDRSCVVYFYPKDFTPGCTSEACAFRDKYEHFHDLGIPVIGISRDTVEIHQKFIKKYNLPFELLSDPSGEVAKWYDAIIPMVKINRRISYFVDSSKIIRGVYTNFFNAENHITEMLSSAGK